MFYYPISRKGLITKTEVINKTPYNLEQHVNTKRDVHCEVCTKQFNNSYVTIRNQLCVCMSFSRHRIRHPARHSIQTQGRPVMLSIDVERHCTGIHSYSHYQQKKLNLNRNEINLF